MTCLLSFALASCGHSQQQKQISRAGEVQFHDLPVLVPVMMLNVKSYNRGVPAGGGRQRTAFYASHVHGLYIMQGDMILDSDAARQQYHATTLPAVSNEAAMASQNIHRGFGPSLVSLLSREFGVDKAKALLENKIYVPSGVPQTAEGLYIPANGPYAVIPPSEGLNQGVYIHTLSARWVQPIEYCVSTSLDSGTHDAVEGAVKMWHDATGLSFSEDQQGACEGTFHKSMMFFVPGNGCASYVGRLSAQVNPVYLRDDCADVGGVAHEIGHALGLFHEQDRKDRDSYIKINTQYIIPGFESQFNHDPTQPEDPFGPYDCGSLMQYPSWAFAQEPGEKTIEPVPGSNCTLSDQLTGPDAQDVQAVKFMYHLAGS